MRELSCQSGGDHMKDDIRSQVCSVMSEVLKIPVQEDSNLVRSQTEQWDSLMHLELILALEEEFRVRFSAEQAANIQSLDDVVTILGENE